MLANHTRVNRLIRVLLNLLSQLLSELQQLFVFLHRLEAFFRVVCLESLQTGLAFILDLVRVIYGHASQLLAIHIICHLIDRSLDLVVDVAHTAISGTFDFLHNFAADCSEILRLLITEVITIPALRKLVHLFHLYNIIVPEVALFIFFVL